jgi:hypothetical protein
LNDATDSDTPVSWFLIERGWKVVASDSSEVGAVDEILGDSSHDIFDGLSVRTGLVGKPRYVPAERVGRITEGRVELELSAAEANDLGAYEGSPVSEEVLPEGGSRWTRLLDSFRRPRT